MRGRCIEGRRTLSLKARTYTLALVDGTLSIAVTYYKVVRTSES